MAKNVDIFNWKLMFYKHIKIRNQALLCIGVGEGGGHVPWFPEAWKWPLTC